MRGPRGEETRGNMCTPTDKQGAGKRRASREVGNPMGTRRSQSGRLGHLERAHQKRKRRSHRQMKWHREKNTHHLTPTPRLYHILHQWGGVWGSADWCAFFPSLLRIIRYACTSSRMTTSNLTWSTPLSCQLELI